jgi:hypothetical protein
MAVKAIPVAAKEQSTALPQIKTRNLILVEDFDDQADAKFLNDVAGPYFKTIFESLSSRSNSPKKHNQPKELFVDNVTFFEYVRLPGIIADRFFSTFERDDDSGHIF